MPTNFFFHYFYASHSLPLPITLASLLFTSTHTHILMQDARVYVHSMVEPHPRTLTQTRVLPAIVLAFLFHSAFAFFFFLFSLHSSFAVAFLRWLATSHRWICVGELEEDHRIQMSLGPLCGAKKPRNI